MTSSTSIVCSPILAVSVSTVAKPAKHKAGNQLRREAMSEH